MCINREEDYLLIITVQFTELATNTLLELIYLKEKTVLDMRQVHSRLATSDQPNDSLYF